MIAPPPPQPLANCSRSPEPIHIFNPRRRAESVHQSQRALYRGKCGFNCHWTGQIRFGVPSFCRPLSTASRCSVILSCELTAVLRARAAHWLTRTLERPISEAALRRKDTVLKWCLPLPPNKETARVNSSTAPVNTAQLHNFRCSSSKCKSILDWMSHSNKTAKHSPSRSISQ